VASHSCQSIIINHFENTVSYRSLVEVIKENFASHVISCFSGGGPVAAAAAAASVLSTDPMTMSAAMAHAANVVR